MGCELMGKQVLLPMLGKVPITATLLQRRLCQQHWFYIEQMGRLPPECRFEGKRIVHSDKMPLGKCHSLRKLQNGLQKYANFIQNDVSSICREQLFPICLAGKNLSTANLCEEHSRVDCKVRKDKIETHL